MCVCVCVCDLRVWGRASGVVLQVWHISAVCCRDTIGDSGECMNREGRDQECALGHFKIKT